MTHTCPCCGCLCRCSQPINDFGVPVCQHYRKCLADPYLLEHGERTADGISRSMQQQLDERELYPQGRA